MADYNKFQPSSNVVANYKINDPTLIKPGV
jgi:hypothetical protein